MDALIREVGAGRRRGTQAFDAIVDLIARHETPRGASESLRRQIHDDVVLVVSQDRELCKMVFAEVARTPRAKPKKAAKAAAKKRRLKEALPPEHDDEPIGPPPLSDEEIDAELEAIQREREARAAQGNSAGFESEFGAPQSRGQLYGALGLASVVLIGGGVWYFTQPTECDRLTKRICVEGNTKGCDPIAFSEALEEQGVDEAKCVATMGALDSAVEGKNNTERPAAFDRALVEALGFDPRGDAAPTPPKPKPEGPPPPTVVVEGQATMSDMFVDRAHVYWTTQEPPGVYRVRNIGGEVEAFGNQVAPLDVTPTKNFVYWISRTPAGASVLSDKVRGSHDLRTVPLEGFSPVRAAFGESDFAFIDGTSGAVMLASVAGGPPRELVAGRAPTAAEGDAAAAPPVLPTDIIGDATHVFVAMPAPVATVWAVPRNGGAPALALATGQNAPGHLAADATHVYWVEATAGTIVRAPRGGGIAEVIAQGQVGAGMLALDEVAVYWPNATTGEVHSVPKAGGKPTTIATGLSTPRYVAADAAAIFWESGGTVYRQAR